MRTFSIVIVVLGVCVSTTGCTDGDACDSAAAELAAARSGDTVMLGTCEISGPLTIPAGVRLVGAGASSTVIRAPASGRGLVISPGSTPTEVSGLTVEANGCVGIVAMGAGSATLRDVDVRAARGVAVAVEGLDRVALTRVNLGGPATDPAAMLPVPLPPYDCATADPATHGLVVVDVAEAALDDVSVRGFSAFGVLAVNSGLQATATTLEDNVGTGLEVYGGTAELDGVTLCGSRQSTAPIESYNGVFAGGASVQSTGLVVCDGETFGLMHDASSATHADLTATGNGFAGVWAQRATAFSLTGSATLFEDNGFAGVALLETDGATIEDATIRGTMERTQFIGATGMVVAADGVHLQSASAELRSLVLENNARAGLLVDLGGGSTTGLTVDSVNVTGSGAALGAIAQNGTVDLEWDLGITRAGDVLVNDAAFSGAIGIANGVGPSCLPDPSSLAAAGIGDLIGAP